MEAPRCGVLCAVLWCGARLRCVPVLYNKRIGGPGSYQSREIPARGGVGSALARVTQEAPARRHYSGLNNIMSRGKRDLCNWTRERARSVGSAEETLLPLSLYCGFHVPPCTACTAGKRERERKTVPLHVWSCEQSSLREFGSSDVDLILTEKRRAYIRVGDL